MVENENEKYIINSEIKTRVIGMKEYNKLTNSECISSSLVDSQIGIGSDNLSINSCLYLEINVKVILI
jgi:hypothetical protein